MAILNQRDYRLAKARRAQLEKATSKKAIIDGIVELPAQLSAARIDTLRTELDRINTEIEAYDELRKRAPNSLEAIEADELGLLPILGRIARKLSQKEFADLLGMKEQQIQRYERVRYANVSLERYQRILAALEVEVHPRLSKRAAPKIPNTSEFNISLSPDLLSDLRKRAWIDLPRSLPPSEMIARISQYVQEAQKLAQTKALHRRRVSAPPADGVLELWTARVLHSAGVHRNRMKGKFNIADTSWLQPLAQLSIYPDGPRRAAEMLREHGIILVIEPHLPKTLLDGAAFILSGGIPIVALTLRYDRIDNFWFTLFHELGHVFMHFNRGLDEGFIDDDLGEPRVSDIEREADDFARNKLIPDEIWANSVVRFTRSESAVLKFAGNLKIHPAIVAGRLRNERGYNLYSDLVGTGQVRNLFVGYTL
ncbi:XRE family transcriptional regulator [Bradyrhizobium japonicum]|uniref:XRE family transcriptional regulator n=1 Tax=Bradyrhizobium japonicum TaxID=375 RepID=UPI000413EB5A|nr:XRE family transcriptional regulator [Bradyrhizobium japonicum]